ncbi:MAG: hypothetical protein R3B07_13300 [Polyangiaceae bacterium]
MFPNQFFTANPYTETYAKLMRAQTARLENLNSQFSELSTQQTKRACESIDETAKLMKDSLQAWGELGSAWQRFALELTRVPNITEG